jgi:trehalose 6-phosphate synthase
MDDFCQYDVVGFQTQQDLDAFNEHLVLRASTTVTDTQRRGERKVVAAAFPIGVDPDEIAGLADAALRATNQANGFALQQKTVIGVDRLDHSKGLPNRLDAYERLLHRYPEHRQQVTFLQIAPPSRTDIDRYRALSELLDQKVGHINGSYAELDWNPIHYVNKTYTQDTLAGLYRRSRVALVTPLRDGMNLVAKEYIAAQDPSDPGVLVLSRFAGAAQELTSALLVNPWDVDQMCDALHRALGMSIAERRARWIEAMAAVRINTASTWCSRFLKALQTNVPEKTAEKPGEKSLERARRGDGRIYPRSEQVRKRAKDLPLIH